jgi:Tfp pilus assembly protein PilN
LRVLEGAVENQGGRIQLKAESLAREARITLGQLPQAVRDPLKRMMIYGPPDVAQQLADELDLRLEALGFKSTVVRTYAPDEFGIKLPKDTPVSAALSLAARHLSGQKPLFEYLPKRVPGWQRVWKHYTSGKLGSAGVVGIAVLVLVSGLFAYQEMQLMRLRSQWSGMEPKVRELESLRDQIRQYRSWYDDSARGLSILRQLTLAFPEDGAVSAKTVEIRDLNTVSCSGVARDNTSLLRMLDKLRGSGGVSELKVNQIRGKAPQLQFTFDFRWSDRNEN